MGAGSAGGGGSACCRAAVGTLGHPRLLWMSCLFLRVCLQIFPCLPTFSRGAPSSCTPTWFIPSDQCPHHPRSPLPLLWRTASSSVWVSGRTAWSGSIK